MTDAIFLSAGVPDPKRGPEYAKTADTVAIAAAVSALTYVTLGRRLLVWGGQPAVTPMIWAIAEGLNVNYGSWVTLYQSQHFKDEYPDDNQKFKNVTYTDDVGRDREQSLQLMRVRMFSEFDFTAAVFVGGMGGIIQEFDLIKQLQPNAALLPIASTGGASLDVAKRLSNVSQDLLDDMDYVGLFHRHLGISVKENRYQNPADQPQAIADRLWQRPASNTQPP
jgi:hypothetical protein